MEEGKREILSVGGESFSLRVGKSLFLEPDGLGEKLRTHFIGMERGAYLIVALNQLGAFADVVFEHLYPGNVVRLFYTEAGEVKGYLCHVLSYTTSPYRHLYLSYPEEGEVCVLRGTERTECHLPAWIGANGSESPGMIANISRGGCGMCVQEGEGLEGLAPESPARVRFSFFSSRVEYEVASVVRNVRPLAGRVMLGLAFEGLDDDLGAKVTDFIHYVRRHA